MEEVAKSLRAQEAVDGEGLGWLGQGKDHLVVGAIHIRSERQFQGCATKGRPLEGVDTLTQAEEQHEEVPLLGSLMDWVELLLFSPKKTSKTTSG